eukprot:tig00021493_g21880.t1
MQTAFCQPAAAVQAHSKSPIVHSAAVSSRPAATRSQTAASVRRSKAAGLGFFGSEATSQRSRFFAGDSSALRAQKPSAAPASSVPVQAAIVDPNMSMQELAKKEPHARTAFHVDGESGYLYCEDVRIKDMMDKVEETPFYVYSKKQITENFMAYQEALKDFPKALVGYSIKANNNLHIIKHLQSLGSGAVLVSGNELRLAIKAGFDPKRTIFNGNGKTLPELIFAAENEVMINVDSEFDLEHIITAAKAANKVTKVLIRINPDVDPHVHSYVSTGIKSSKFGIRNTHIDWFLKRIKEEPMLRLVGAHSHLGSTISEVTVFRDAAQIMIGFIKKMREAGFDSVEWLDIGGGLGIDYSRTGVKYPTPADLVATVKDLILETGVGVILEPGRSIVGNSGMLVNKVTGVKTNGNVNFIVTDGSMAELIRPSLYDAYQHIDIAEPVSGPEKMFNVVGPVCESGDFLGKERMLPEPHEGAGLVVYDAGAYGFSMSSNYNIKMRPAEYLVDGDSFRCIRKRQSFEDWCKDFDV